ncbi:MAG: KamA family radical SAM protein [Thermodesulfobacteriota bacterium]
MTAYGVASWTNLLEGSLVTPDRLAQALPVDRGETEEVSARSPLRINPYYLSLIRYPRDPIWLQVIPDRREIEDTAGMEDPLDEERLSPVPNLVHRYPDRVLFLVSHRCATYCRFCNRKRKIGLSFLVNDATIGQGLDYIARHPEVRDVLLSGGDPLLLEDSFLDRLLSALRAIPHVEIIRIGSRVPCTLPHRITPSLCRTLRRHHPLYVSTHFNHPWELTPEAKKACSRLVDHGIPVGNQTVLLRGVNDDPVVLAELMRGLAVARVKPYYLFHPDPVKGTSHFRMSIPEGLKIMDALLRSVPRLCVPDYVVDLPRGGGKVPLLPGDLRR